MSRVFCSKTASSCQSWQYITSSQSPYISNLPVCSHGSKWSVVSDRSNVMHRIEHLHHVQSGRLSHYDTWDGLSVFTRSTGCPKKVTFRMLLKPKSPDQY